MTEYSGWTTLLPDRSAFTALGLTCSDGCFVSIQTKVDSILNPAETIGLTHVDHKLLWNSSSDCLCVCDSVIWMAKIVAFLEAWSNNSMAPSTAMKLYATGTYRRDVWPFFGEKLVKGWFNFKTCRRHSTKLGVDSPQTMSKAYLLGQEASDNGIVRSFNCFIPQCIQKWSFVELP